MIINHLNPHLRVIDTPALNADLYKRKSNFIAMKNFSHSKQLDLPRFLKDIDYKNIRFFRASSNYTSIILNTGEVLVSGYSLKVFDKLYNSPEFLRIDRSNLVNTDFIEGYVFKNDGFFVVLQNQTELKVPRRRTTFIQTLLTN